MLMSHYLLEVELKRRKTAYEFWFYTFALQIFLFFLILGGKVSLFVPNFQALKKFVLGKFVR